MRLLLREVYAWDEEPHSREGQPIAWFSPDELADLPMPAADRPMIKALTLDARYLISPDPARFRDTADFMALWQARLDAGFRWLVLRAGGLDRNELETLATACGQLARRYAARWLIEDDAELAEAVGADGVHLSPGRLVRCENRPLPESRLVCAECHDGEQMQLAGRLGLDFIISSRVTAAEPTERRAASEWRGLGQTCAQSPLPLLAPGRVGAFALQQAREHGAFGLVSDFADVEP